MKPPSHSWGKLTAPGDADHGGAAAGGPGTATGPAGGAAVPWSEECA